MTRKNIQSNLYNKLNLKKETLHESRYLGAIQTSMLIRFSMSTYKKLPLFSIPVQKIEDKADNCKEEYAIPGPHRA